MNPGVYQGGLGPSRNRTRRSCERRVSGQDRADWASRESERCDAGESAGVHRAGRRGAGGAGVSANNPVEESASWRVRPNESSESSLVPAAVVFEFSLAGVAVLLGWLFGINPFQGWPGATPVDSSIELVCGRGVAVLPLLVFRWLQEQSIGPLSASCGSCWTKQLLPHFAHATRTGIGLAVAGGGRW